VEVTKIGMNDLDLIFKKHAAAPADHNSGIMAQ